MQRKELAKIVGNLHTPREMREFLSLYFNHYIWKSLLNDLSANIKDGKERIIFARLVAEHNAICRKIRHPQLPTFSDKTKPTIFTKKSFSKALNDYANEIIDNKRIDNKTITKKKKKKKSAKVIREEIRGLRGSRIAERFSCSHCGCTVDEGWRYNTETEIFKFCCSCKNDLKPSTFLKTRKSIIYTAMGNDRRRRK